jgi:hypothetical protein
MEIVIEKNVEMPVADGPKVKLDLMEIGDSFSFPRADRTKLAILISKEFHAVSDKRFTISVKNQPKDKARVWRVKDYVKEETA